MLYIFQVDSGKMLTLDMNLALESVANLKSVLRDLCKIPVEKQVLLISGGYSLEPSSRVSNYSAGTDTSPIFLFDKTAIENLTPPYLEPPPHAEEVEMHEKVEGSLNMPPSYNTVVSRAQLAQEFFERSKEQRRNCERLVHDQHLMQQGWAAVVANLEDITGIFKSRSEAFQKNFLRYLEHRIDHLELLNNFRSDLSLLSKIPVLPILLKAQEEEEGIEEEATVNLLHWISSKDNQNSLEQMAEICTKCLNKFDESVLHNLLSEVAVAQKDVDNADMKEIKGLEERLCGLEQLMFEARKTVDDQGSLAQAFHQNQNRASNLKDASILPDLCASHKQQLQLVLKNQLLLCDIKRRCLRAKAELCYNLHARLRWIMFVEGKLHNLDNKLSIYNENLKRIQSHLEIVRQIHQAPRIYMAAVAEVLRRRQFSKLFLQWADQLSGHSRSLHRKEVETREAFNCQLTNHFLSNLFPGMDDSPPPFATENPSAFDARLPPVEGHHLDLLRRALPELGHLLEPSAEPPTMPSSQFRPPVSTSTQTVTSESGVDTYMTRSGGSVNVSESRSESSLAVAIRKHEKEGGVFCPIREEVWPVEGDFETLDHNLAEQLEETHRSQLIKAGSEPGGGSSAAHATEESMQRARSEGDVTVPLTLSQDFLTADFYIDESMPSSYTESNGLRPVGNRPVKSHHALLAELQNQLEECNGALARAKEELKLKNAELCEEKCKFKAFESSFREELAKERANVLQIKEEMDNVQKNVNQELVAVTDRFNVLCSSIHEKLEMEKEMHLKCQESLKDRILLEKTSLQKILDSDPTLQERCKEHPNELVTAAGIDFGFLFKLRNDTKDDERISKEGAEITALNEEIQNIQLKLTECCNTLALKETEGAAEMAEYKKALKNKFVRETQSVRISCSHILRQRAEGSDEMWKKLQERQENCWNDIKKKLNSQLSEQNESFSFVSVLDSFVKSLMRWVLEDPFLIQQSERALKQLRSATRCSVQFEHKHNDLCTTSLDAFDVALPGFLKFWRTAINSFELHQSDILEDAMDCFKKSKTLDIQVAVARERAEWEKEAQEREAQEREAQEREAREREMLEREAQEIEQEIAAQQRNQRAMISSVQSEPQSCGALGSSEIGFPLDPYADGMPSSSSSSPPQKSARFHVCSKESIKVSVLKCKVDDVVLLTYDEKYDTYVVFILDATLHFLKSECLELLGLNQVAGQPRRAWALGVVTEKEYCKAKKFPNRYHVKLDSRFYRVSAKPWPLAASSNFFAPST